MRPVSRPSSASQAATLVRRAVEVPDDKVENSDKMDGSGSKPSQARIRPVSAVPVGLSGSMPTATYPARTRPQSAAATKLASQGFAAAMVAVKHSTPQIQRPTSSLGHSHHIGRLVGRGRIAHMAAAAQARNQSPPKRALSAGHSAPCLRPAIRPEVTVEAPSAGLDARQGKRPSQEKLQGDKCVFEEIMRTDEFFGTILKEIKASYKSTEQPVPTVFSEASPAEIAVDAIRRPWIEDGTDTNDCDTARANSSPLPPQKVRQLEQENLALRELLRRCHGQLKRRPVASAQSEPLPVAAATSLSVWSSPEPLAAKMRRPPPDRPSSVPALNLSEIDDESEYDEGEEEEDDYYEDYPLHNPNAFAGAGAY